MNFTELRQKRQQAIVDLVARAETKAALSRMLGISYQTINAWITKGAISDNGAYMIARHPVLGREFPISRTRPDLSSTV